MKNKTKILYVWEHDVSLGDALTNFHAHLSIVKDRNPLSIIYVISHPRTYNTGVLNLLIDKGLIDFVYPFQISKLNDELNGHFKNLLINLNIDIIIHNKHTEYESVKLLQDEFKNSIHLQTNDSNFNLQNTFNFFNIRNNTEFLQILKKSYHMNYVEEFVNYYTKLSQNKKTLAIFSGSTRPLANLGKEGLKNIIKLTSDLNIHTFLIGTSMFNLYNINGVNWNEIYMNDYCESINLIGNNWTKTISLMKKVDLILTGPTGSSMISPLINKKQILILGGDSPIMEDCLNNYTSMEDTFKLKCECENYPCYINNKNNIGLYQKCFIENHPYCLNENLNIKELRKMLENI